LPIYAIKHQGIGHLPTPSATLGDSKRSLAENGAQFMLQVEPYQAFHNMNLIKKGRGILILTPSLSAETLNAVL
jgi:hypothetical protein